MLLEGPDLASSQERRHPDVREAEDSLRGFNCKGGAVARALLLLSLPFTVQGLSDLAANFLPSQVAGALGDLTGVGVDGRGRTSPGTMP